MLPFYVYIIQCKDGSYYVGHTDNIEIRIDQHYRGEGSTYVRKRLPIKLVFVDEFPSRNEAFEVKRKIKKWTRKKKEALIEHHYEKLIPLAKKVFKK